MPTSCEDWRWGKGSSGLCERRLCMKTKNVHIGAVSVQLAQQTTQHKAASAIPCKRHTLHKQAKSGVEMQIDIAQLTGFLCKYSHQLLSKSAHACDNALRGSSHDSADILCAAVSQNQFPRKASIIFATSVSQTHNH